MARHSKIPRDLRPRGPQPTEITPWEYHVVVTVARSFPWYGYKKIALICARLAEPIPYRKVYRIMRDAGLLHQRKKRLEERARQEAIRLYQLLPKAPNELWQTGNGPSFIARRFRQELDDLRIAATGLSAFSQVRIGYRMPTQLGLLERFHETLKYEEVYWNLYADPRDARQKLAVFHERYNEARPHWALVAAEPASAPARILSPYEVYVKGYKVNPPKWSRWVGWLEKDQETAAEPSNRTPVPVSA